MFFFHIYYEHTRWKMLNHGTDLMHLQPHNYSWNNLYQSFAGRTTNYSVFPIRSHLFAKLHWHRIFLIGRPIRYAGIVWPILASAANKQFSYAMNYYSTYKSTWASPCNTCHLCMHLLIYSEKKYYVLQNFDCWNLVEV